MKPVAIYARVSTERQKVQETIASQTAVLLEHAASQADVEEGQNEALLTGMSEILHRVEGLEKQILQLEHQIVNRLDAGTSAAANPGSE